VLIDDALDCLISFSDFIYAFQVQFFYEGKEFRKCFYKGKEFRKCFYKGKELFMKVENFFIRVKSSYDKPLSFFTRIITVQPVS
jgi:hypothetical protein